MPAPSDDRQRADKHDCEADNHGDAGRVSPSAHQAPYARLAGEQPLPHCVVVLAGRPGLDFGAALRPLVASAIDIHGAEVD